MKHRIEWLTACAAVSFFGMQFVAAAEPQAPKPGPEHKRLGFFVGNWSTVVQTHK